jgi:aspartate aminotransferase-like enzyme
MSRPKLMLPGPIDIWEETLDALSQQVLPHYGDDFTPIWLETIEMLKEVFQTKNDVIIITAPGSGALDAAVSSLFAPGEQVVVVNNGPFAIRLIEIFNAYNCDVISVDDEWGQPGDVDKMRRALEQYPDAAGLAVVANDTGVGVRNPVEAYAELARAFDLPIFVDGVSAIGGYDIPVDQWGIDLAVTSSNKALETAPGLGILSVSDRAWDIINSKSNTHRGWYYDLSMWKRMIDQSPSNPYPTTQASSLIVSLHASLNRILKKETLKGHWARYAWAQSAVRTGLSALALHPVVAEDSASYTVTTFHMHEAMQGIMELRDYLVAHHGLLVATAMGSFADHVLRAGHMGKACSQEYVELFLLGVEDFLRTVYKQDIPHGLSLDGMKIPHP